MLNELLKSVLVLGLSFAVRWFFTLINVQIDDATFNAIVAGLVTYILSLLGLEVAARAAPRYFSVKR
jgi:hypothetical protein